MSIDQTRPSFARSRQLLESNEQAIPGGLASINRRAEPCIAFAQAVGSRLRDVDGNEYIDYHAAFSAYILGHGDSDQTTAVIAALESGRSNYGSGPTEDEGELGRLFLRCVPGADKVQFFNTGSEATAQAIRVAPDVPIASNTSAIPITSLQEGRWHPDRFLGMHRFEPAHATRFLELVPGEYTCDATMNAAIALARRCGKNPSVLAKDIPGFIVNRLGYALLREALSLLALGVADAETIDRSFRNVCGVWSTVFDPLQWIDLTGGPVLHGECMKHFFLRSPTPSNCRK